MRPVEIPLGLVHVGLSQGGAHVLETKPIGGESRGVGLNAHRRFLTAADADQPDA